MLLMVFIDLWRFRGINGIDKYDMRIKEIILEYKRDITASKLGEKLYVKLLSEPEHWIRRSLGGRIVSIAYMNYVGDQEKNNENKNKVIDAILEKIEAADPTNNKQYVMWIIRVYLNTKIYLEDAITRPTRALAKFYKLTRAKKIQPPYNDINRIKDINQLEEVVSQFPDEEKKLVDRGNYEEIYRDNEIRVIVPLDETAACYYGQGTKWCTASDTNNKFNEYTEDGAKLYIILPQNPTYPGEKYQLCFEDNQFKNELDDPVNPTKLFDKYYSLRKAFKTILFGTDYELLLYENPSEAVQLAAVKRYGYAIQYIKNPTEKVQLAAVREVGHLIQYIENPSEKVQLTAVNRNGLAMRYIENPNEAVQLAAVKQNGYAIFYIKNPSEEMQIAAIKQDVSSFKHIKNPTPKVVKLYKELTS